MGDEERDGHRPSPPAGDEPATLGPKARAAVIHRIRTLMEFWSIEPEELEGPLPPVASPAAPATRPVKYRHPVTGDTWDGQGTHPDWLREALLKQGYTVDELRAAAAAG